MTKLAGTFNFDGRGNPTSPLVAQDTAEVRLVAKDYILAKTRFAGASEAAELRDKAE